MARAIPANQIVSVIPSVISGGGSALNLSGLILTPNPRVPIGTVLPFHSALAVSNYFGATAQETTLANIYFLGFDGSTVKPGSLLFSQYPLTPVGAWLRSGSLAAMTLATLQGLSGSLIVTIDGVVKTAASIVLASASSFSAAAALIATGLGLSPITGASVTGSITTNVLTVTGVSSGILAVGQTLAGGTIGANTTILAQLTGTPGGVGNYTVSVSQTVTSTTITATSSPVIFDSVANAFQIFSASTGAASTVGFASGTLAAPLALDQADGAITSQGAPAGVPATNMAAIVGISQNWASFMTAWEPIVSDKVAFAAWSNAQLNEYVYAMWTTNAAATVANDTTTSGALIRAANYGGIALIYQTGALGDKAAFLLGMIASLDFGATNGRSTAAFRGQTGLAADVTDQTIAANLIANGYNFYGTYATANSQFTFFYPGQITGPFNWIDSYVDQIWLNNGFQLALMNLLTQIKSIPYNQVGYSLIRAACLDPIIAALNFGAIRAGVTVSQSQAAAVNFAAGTKIDDVLSTRGWFLQIIDATSIVRAARQSPPCSFWYMDGQSVQKINLASVEVQ